MISHCSGAASRSERVGGSSGGRTPFIEGESSLRLDLRCSVEGSSKSGGVMGDFGVLSPDFVLAGERGGLSPIRNAGGFILPSSAGLVS